MFDVAYLLLAIFTASIFAGIYALWRLTRTPHFVLGLGLIYHYSLSGAWKIVGLKWSGAENISLDHLEASLFPITIDENYLLTICIYGVFNLALIISLFFLVVGPARLGGTLRTFREYPVSVAHGRLLLIALVALISSVFLIRSAFVSALDSGTSLYSASRSETNQFFTIHQLLNRVGLACLVIGLGVCLLEKRRFMWLASYGLLAMAWMIFLGALGNRSELLVAAIAVVLFCYSLGARFGTVRTFVVAFGAFFVLRLIESTRGAELGGEIADLGDTLWSLDFWNPLALATGSESLAAHMSLYGVLSENLDFTYGSSLLYLANSLLPRLVSAQRVADSYSTYASAVGAPEVQGFNIHYAAAWYLNFGLLAVVIGAAILAAFWGWLYRFQASQKFAPSRRYVPVLVAFCFCSAYVPVLMRGGPEGFKSLLIEGVIIPYLLTRFALRSHRPAAVTAPSFPSVR